MRKLRPSLTLRETKPRKQPKKGLVRWQESDKLSLTSHQTLFCAHNGPLPRPSMPTADAARRALCAAQA